MKSIVLFFTGFFTLVLTGYAYSNLYLKCDEASGLSSACHSGNRLYLIPEGAIYANRIHNPREIPDHWCPNKPYAITRAELKGGLLNAQEVEVGKGCPTLKRYTATIWAGDPYCLDPNFEARTKPDWTGRFYACAKNIRVSLGEKYFLVYAIVGDAFDSLEQVIDDNRILNSDTGEMQQGFVSFMITREEEIPPVVKVSQTKERNLKTLRDAISDERSEMVQVDCRIRPHNYEDNEKFDASVSVSKLISGDWQEVLSLNVLENVSHGEARMALGIEACEEVTFFGY
ncbi:MAG: hypothetical protein K6L81_03810 [Agarilytica sp.]